MGDCPGGGIEPTGLARQVDSLVFVYDLQVTAQGLQTFFAQKVTNHNRQDAEALITSFALSNGDTKLSFGGKEPSFRVFGLDPSVS